MLSNKALTTSPPSGPFPPSTFVPGGENASRANSPRLPRKRLIFIEPQSPEIDSSENLPSLKELAERRFKLDLGLCKIMRRTCLYHIERAMAKRLMRARGGREVSKPCVRPVGAVSCPCKEMGTAAIQRGDYWVVEKNRRTRRREESRGAAVAGLQHPPGFQSLEIDTTWTPPLRGMGTSNRMTQSSLTVPRRRATPPSRTIPLSRATLPSTAIPPSMTPQEFIAATQELMNEICDIDNRSFHIPPSPQATITPLPPYEDYQSHNTPLDPYSETETETATTTETSSPSSISSSPSQDPTTPEFLLPIPFKSAHKRKRCLPRCTFCHELGHEALECPVCDICLCSGHRRGQCVVEFDAESVLVAATRGAHKVMWEEAWKVCEWQDGWVEWDVGADDGWVTERGGA